MRKFLNVLIILLSACLFSFTLTACNDENVPPHIHDYATQKSDEEYHWNECSCGNKSNFESHKGGTATETSKAVCSVCNQEYGVVISHPHSFLKKVVEVKYLKSPATCESKAEYYYSCECGAKGTSTFKHGEKLGHAYGEKISNGNGQHVQTCANDSNHTIIEACSGGIATCEDKAVCVECGSAYGSAKGHNFILQELKTDYLKSPATCESKAEYYYSCECGAKGTSTFNYGEELGHAYGEKISNGNGQHVQTCANDSNHTIIEACSGGTATCGDKAVCVECGSGYGDTKAHTFGTYYCTKCYTVNADMSANVVELGIPTTSTFGEKDLRNSAWDTYYYNGKIYRGSGSIDFYKMAPIWSYDVIKGRWYKEIVTEDTAIQRFLEIDGKLVAPGADPTGENESWNWGFYYALDENGWTKDSSVPDGVHMFDVIEYDGKIFYGLGSNYNKSPLKYTENGTDYTTVYFYKNGVKINLSQCAQEHTAARVYELFTYKGDLYALLSYLGVNGVYKFDGTKMVCVNEEAHYGQFSGNYNVWVADFDTEEVFYMVSGAIYAITDFSDAIAFTRYTPNSQVDVSDALYRDGKYYILTYVKTAVEGKYKTIIYESETMEKDSFTEVVSFDYEITPLTFDKVGDDFYVSMGGKNSISSTKNGMMLKVKGN